MYISQRQIRQALPCRVLPCNILVLPKPEGGAATLEFAQKKHIKGSLCITAVTHTRAHRERGERDTHTQTNTHISQSYALLYLFFLFIIIFLTKFYCFVSPSEDLLLD